MNKLPKTIVIASVAVLLTGAGALSAQHYDQYHKQQLAAQKVAQEKQAAQVKELAALKADVQVLAKTANDNRLGCEKGQASYDMLPVANKAKIVRATCSPVIVR